MQDEAPAPKPGEIISIFHPKVVVTASAYAESIDIYMDTDSGRVHIKDRFIGEAMLKLRKCISEQILRPAPTEGGL